MLQTRLREIKIYLFVLLCAGGVIRDQAEIENENVLLT